MGWMKDLLTSKGFTELADMSAKVDVGLATPEELAAYKEKLKISGALDGTGKSGYDMTATETYQQALLKYQAQAQQGAAQAQVKDVINLRAAEERASRVVTLDNRKVNISVGGTSDAEELRRRRTFSSTNIRPLV